MNNTTLLVAVAALLLGVGGGYLMAERTELPPPTLGSTATIPTGMHRMHNGALMSNGTTNVGMGMNHGMMMVSSEREFITEMIPHHQEAVDTAKEVLARGATTPEIRTLLENIITAQEREIADMKTWHQAWYGTEYQPSGNYQPMMRDLSTLSGVDIDRAFLEDMVMHHMGAIMMAQSVQPYIEHDEIRTLATAIIDSQSKEIQQMREMYAAL